MFNFLGTKFYGSDSPFTDAKGYVFVLLTTPTKGMTIRSFSLGRAVMAERRCRYGFRKLLIAVRALCLSHIDDISLSHIVRMKLQLISK